MKKNLKYPIFVLFLLFFFYGSDIFYSILILKDNNLNENTVTLNEYQALKKEYDTLLEQNDLFTTEEENKMISKVILRNPLEFFDTITILKGKEENVEVGDIVYNEIGYIGQVKKVFNHSSEVELIFHKNTTLSVKINNSYGILQRENEKLVVKNITSKEEFKEGDIVVTSDFSNIPGNIPVAKVVSVSKLSVEQVLEVTPLVSLKDINYVLLKRKINYD